MLGIQIKQLATTMELVLAQMQIKLLQVMSHNQKQFANYVNNHGNTDEMINDIKLHGIGNCKCSELTLIHLKNCTDTYVGSRAKPAKLSSFAKSLS